MIHIHTILVLQPPVIPSIYTVYSSPQLASYLGKGRTGGGGGKGGGPLNLTRVKEYKTLNIQNIKYQISNIKHQILKLRPHTLDTPNYQKYRGRIGKKKKEKKKRERDLFFPCFLSFSLSFPFFPFSFSFLSIIIFFPLGPTNSINQDEGKKKKSEIR